MLFSCPRSFTGCSIRAGVAPAVAEIESPAAYRCGVNGLLRVFRITMNLPFGSEMRPENECRSGQQVAGQAGSLAGGPKHYRDRCDGRRYLASWLQFARLRVDLELHDGVGLLVGDV